MLSVTGSVSIHPGYTILGLVIHWFAAASWHYVMYQAIYKNVIVSAAVGILNTVLSRVDNILNANISLAILVIEDIAMMTVWIVFSEAKIKNSPIYIPFLSISITSCIMGTVSSTIYIFYQQNFMVVKAYNV